MALIISNTEFMQLGLFSLLKNDSIRLNIFFASSVDVDMSESNSFCIISLRYSSAILDKSSKYFLRCMNISSILIEI